MASQSRRALNPSILARLDAALQGYKSILIELRRHIHQHPELSGHERETTMYLSERLKSAGIRHKIGPDRRGIITDIVRPKKKGGPVVALRAELDALPIQEENKTTYRSVRPGIMHACGHDAHAAMLLITSLALRSLNEPSVGWRCVFQPSEEIGHGACDMIQEGALEGVDAIIALHVDPNREVGQIGITAGPRSAYCQDFVLQVRGRGGHGARPHNTVDPIAISTQLLAMIYQNVPRRTDARDPVVVTIGMIAGGNAPNVIPDAVVIKGTIRALDKSVVEMAREVTAQISAGVAQAFGAQITPLFDPLLNGMTNDSEVAAICLQAASGWLGVESIFTEDRPSMGAEDFADFLAQVPGCMMTLGVRKPRKKITPLHTSRFDVDERALLLGTQLLARVLLHWPTTST